MTYVNPDLVEAAGGSMEDVPDALDDTAEGLWVHRHDRRVRSLPGSHGGRPMAEDDSDVTFGDEAGLTAASLHRRFAEEGGMSSMSQDDARQAFPTGTLGIVACGATISRAWRSAARSASSTR